MTEKEIEEICNRVSVGSDEDTLFYFKNKLENLKYRYSGNVELFKKHSYRLRKQMSIMEEIVAFKKSV